MDNKNSITPGRSIQIFLVLASFTIPVLASFGGTLMSGVMAVVSALAVGALILNSPKQLPRYDKWCIRLLFLFFCWALLTATWSIIPERSLDIWARISLLTVMGVGLLAYSRVLDSTVQYRCAIMLSAGFAAALSLIMLEALIPGGALIHWIVVEVYGRAHFTLEDLNRTACILALMVWPTVLAVRHFGLRRFSLFLPVLSWLALLALESLAAALSLGVSIIAWAVMAGMPRLGVRMVAWGVPALFLLWPVLVWSVDWPAQLNNGLGWLPESAQHRIMIWDFTLERIEEKPWLGWGMDSARKIPGGTASFRDGEAYLPLHPHNIVLQVMLELGIVGWLLLVALSWRVFRAVAKADMDMGNKHILLALMLTYVGIAMPAFGVWQSWWLGTVWLAGSWAMLLMPRREAVRVAANAPQADNNQAPTAAPPALWDQDRHAQSTLQRTGTG